MKKIIIPMMLGLVTFGALTSCNSQPTTNLTNDNYNVVNVKRANETESSKVRVVNSFGKYDLDNIVITTSKDLGLDVSVKYKKPNWDDFDNAESFEYMGYTYTATTTDGTTAIKKTAYSSDASTVEVVYTGSVEGCDSFTQNFTSYSSFTSCKTLIDVMQISTQINGIKTLENIYFGTSVSINNLVIGTVKNMIFTCDPTNFSGLKYINPNTRLIAPASIAANIRKKLDNAYKNEKDYMSYMPILYVIPDEELIYQADSFRPCYEIGGAYITAPSSGSLSYGISYIGSRTKKTVIDLTLLADKNLTYIFPTRNPDLEVSELEEMYYAYPSSSATEDLFSPFTIEKLHLGNIRGEFWSGNFDGVEEVYFPDGLETGYESIYLNSGENLLNTTFYFPNSEKEEPTVFENLITELNKSSYGNVAYYDASTYKPTMEVEVNGVRKSTQDMTVSYSSLVAEAAEEAEKISNNENEVSEDEMTEEEKEKLAQDQAAADEVIALIDTIGEVTLDSRDVIVNTKAAYDELTYDQQQLVENKETLKEAVVAFNELVSEYNENLEEGEEQLELIEEINDKTKFDDFLESVKENKVLTAITVVLGTVLGGFLIYGIYKLISKLIKWVKR